MSELAGGMKGPTPFIINSDIKPSPPPKEEEDSHDMLIGWNRPKKNNRKVHSKKGVSDNEEGNKSNLDAPTDTEQRVPLQKFID